nr:unnamed protein product [Callosobruchus analis]
MFYGNAPGVSLAPYIIYKAELSGPLGQTMDLKEPGTIELNMDGLT